MNQQFFSKTDQTLWKTSAPSPHTQFLPMSVSFGVFGQTDWSVLTVWCDQLARVCEIAV